MNTAYPSPYQAVFLCLHPKELKKSYADEKNYDICKYSSPNITCDNTVERRARRETEIEKKR